MARAKKSTRLNTNQIIIEPGDYRGRYKVDNQDWAKGRNPFYLEPGLHAIDTGAGLGDQLHGQSSFFFIVDEAGKAQEISNPIAAQHNENKRQLPPAKRVSRD